MALSLEKGSRAKVDSVATSFIIFQVANGRPKNQFAMEDIIEWITDYCRVGLSSSSLDGRLSSLRRHARRQRQYFPPFDSDDWLDIKDEVRALKKIDPLGPNRATVVGMFWIQRVIAQLGIRTVDDLYTCQPWVLQLVCRALLVHACCMRGVEHRWGMKLGAILTITESVIRVGVASRWSQKKQKLRGARVCVLPVQREVWSVGYVMFAYLKRFFDDDSPASAILFPAIDSNGWKRRKRANSDADFIKQFKPYLKQAGMEGTHLRRVTNHSFRAGGATDWTVAGMGADFVKQQGGWTSSCYMIYVRPTAVHCWTQAVRLIKATTSLVGQMAGLVAV